MVVLKKCKSSTLIEVLIASVIIMVVLSITTVLLLQLTQNHYKVKVQRVQTVVNKEMYFKGETNLEDLKGWKQTVEKSKNKVLLKYVNEKKRESLTRMYAY